MLNITPIFDGIKKAAQPVLDFEFPWIIKLFALMLAIGSTPLLLKAFALNVGFWALLVPAYFVVLSATYDILLKPFHAGLRWLFGVKKIKIDIFGKSHWHVNADSFFAADRTSLYPYKTTLVELEKSLNEQLIHQHFQSSEERKAIIHLRMREIVDYMPSYFYGSDRREVHTSQYDVSEQDIENFRIRRTPRKYFP